MDKTVYRLVTPHALGTWTFFKNPLEELKELEKLVTEIDEKQPKFTTIIRKFRKNLKSTQIKTLVKRHVTKNETGEVNKKSLGSLFRAVGFRILPKNIFGNNKNLETFCKNVNLLFLAGKETRISGSDLIRNIDIKCIDWTLNENSLAELAVWITQKIFWRLAW